MFSFFKKKIDKTVQVEKQEDIVLWHWTEKGLLQLSFSNNNEIANRYMTKCDEKGQREEADYLCDLYSVKKGTTGKTVLRIVFYDRKTGRKVNTCHTSTLESVNENVFTTANSFYRFSTI